MKTEHVINNAMAFDNRNPTADLERAIRARLAQLWDSGTQRSRAETAGFLLAEIDPILQRWIDEEGR